MNKKDYYIGNLETDYEESLRNETGKEWLVGDFDKFANKNVRRVKDFEIKYWKFKKGEEDKHKPKKQKSATEWTVVLDGEVRGVVNGEQVTLKKGDFIIIKPGVTSDLIGEIIKDVRGLTVKAPSITDDTIR